MRRLDEMILIIEDSAEDYEATVRAIQRANESIPLSHCVDGDDALDWLHRLGRYAGQQLPRPAFILLDLNLPGTDGREVLRTIKTDSLLADIPVVILTTSSNPLDIADCYRAGANTYIIKPVNLPLFYDAISCLVQYWLQVAVLPRSDIDSR